MDLDDILIEKLRLWSSEALKYILCVRKTNVEGSFDELVTRGFAAHEENVPVYSEAEKASSPMQ